MLLHFGRRTKSHSVQAEGDADTNTNAAAATSRSASPSASPPKKQQQQQQRSPPRAAAAMKKKISPLRVHIPNDDGDDDGEIMYMVASPPPPLSSSSPDLPPSPLIAVRAAELTLELPPPSPTSPSHSSPSSPSSPTSTSTSPSAASSPRVRRTPSGKQSHMRGLSVMSYRLKQLVSKEKRRFDEDGFNLDLTYVTTRLVAFGYPAENLEGIYRNHYKDVYNFFERRHPERYKIYNLCAERSYDKDKFHGRVSEFPFYDHCPPPLALFTPFCEDVDAWLREHPDNVAAIHCKAGKGRTGVMICAYLLYTRAWTTAYGAMEFFGAARSLKREGVTIPSQRRFIRYFADMCQRAATATHDGDHGASSDAQAVKELAMKAKEFHQLWEDTIDGRGVGVAVRCLQAPSKLALPPTTRLVLTKIRLRGVYAHKRIDPRACVECGTGKAASVYDLSAMFLPSDAVGEEPSAAAPATTTTATHSAPPPTPSTPSSATKSASFWATTHLELPCGRLLVWDEVKLSLCHRTGAKLGHLWFHTAFVPSDTYELTIPKEEIDKVNKDAKRGHKLYGADFSITLVFEKATAEDTATLRASFRTSSAPDVTAQAPPEPPLEHPSPKLRAFASLNELLQFGGGARKSPTRSRAISDETEPPALGDGEMRHSPSPPTSPRSFSRRFFNATFSPGTTAGGGGEDEHVHGFSESDDELAGAF